MFDFKKEISKYKPLHEIDQVEKIITENEIEDIMDMLSRLSEKKNRS